MANIALETMKALIEKNKQRKSEAIKNDPLFIERYDYDQGDGNWRFPGHTKTENGEWVPYEDHLRIVEYLKKQIDKAYQDGKASGRPEYSWRV